MIEIDVVIPVYNGAEFVGRALDSLLGQTHTPNRIIVVDDGSTDKTQEVLAGYVSKIPNLAILTQTHEGLSATRNKGIQASTADYISFLDCDDYWTPTKLENQVKHLEAHFNCAAIFSNCYLNDETNRSLYITQGNGKEEFSFLNVLTQKYRVMGSASSICVRREIFNEVGKFDVSKSYGEDFDLWVRIAARNKICEIRLRDVVITKRVNSMQTSKATGLAKFKNSNTYLSIWGSYMQILNQERKTFERLIFPDVARTFFKNPWDLQIFFEYSAAKFPAIHGMLFPRRMSVVSFLIRNFIWYSIHAVKSIFMRILRKSISIHLQ